VLVVGGATYVIGANQAKWDAVARRPGVAIGLLTPTEWETGLGDLARLERRYPSLDYFPTRVWFGRRRGAHLYPPSAFREAVAAFRPDIVHVELESFALGAFEMAWFAERVGLPFGLFCWENTDRFLWPPRRLTRWLTLRAAAFAVAGNAEAAELLVRWGLRGPVEVMPQMGVDPEAFAPRPAPPPEPFIVGYLGRFVPEKGLDLLLAAVRTLRGRGVPARAILYGAGPAAPALRRLAASLALEEHVEFRAAVPHDRVPEALAGFHVLVLPSRTVPGWREQFGRVLIEAMAMAVPVIGSACGEIPRVIGRADAVFPENDHAALAARLERVARDPAWRAELAGAGRARVEEWYSHARVAERLVAFWRRATGR
jgi:glycosyltransferase involved in cell wall biosynthesis